MHSAVVSEYERRIAELAEELAKLKEKHKALECAPPPNIEGVY